MTTSSKKKKDKKKDFQKPKLRVGKAAPKAANSTSTSFKAKSISLKQQALSANAPTLEAQCAHHLGLLDHKADKQRQESLAFLTSAIIGVAPGASLPQPASVIIPAVQRLILDPSNAVRQQLLKLLKVLPENEVASHADQLLLHTRAGMTHLSVEIRTFALEVLQWLISVAGDEVVSCAGGWVKMLKCFLSLLIWKSEGEGKWSQAKSYGKSDAKLQVKQMDALTAFLRAGLYHAEVAAVASNSSFPLWQTEHHMLPERSNVFAHLNLFSATRDEDAEMFEDREDRQRLFNDRAEAAVIAGLEQALKAGGEMGRAAAQLRKVVKDGMADFHREEIMV
ncbi:rRNA processing protein [Didymella pomorum]|uniref:Pre-rRNA-processing protein n=1 Tax=Didymella pomorum TaxID=749634 RepID=A0A9W9D2Q1_9PLEO|nr:rRNA processing protein [Didymella pomorum]